MKRLSILFIMVPLLTFELRWGSPNLWAIEKVSRDFFLEQIRSKVIAEKLQISLTLVRHFRKEKMEWGEICRLIIVAKKSHQMIETILQLRQNDVEWKDIARRYYLDLKHINEESRAMERELERIGSREKFLEKIRSPV